MAAAIPRNYTGERLRPNVRRQLLALVSQGKSDNKIAKELKVSRDTIRAFKDREAETISQRKQTLLGTFLRIAETGADQIEEQLMDGKITPNMLVPVVGMSTDKVQLLGGDPSMIIRHEHDHRHIHVDLANDFDSFLSELPASNHEAMVLPVLDVEESASCAPKEQENYSSITVEPHEPIKATDTIQLHITTIGLPPELTNPPYNSSPEPPTP